MFKTIKNTRRRFVESILEGVGVSEVDEDKEYDNLVENANIMFDDINECGANLHSLLVQQKTFFSDITLLSDSISRIFSYPSTDSSYFHGLNNGLQPSEKAAVEFKAKMETIHNVVRSSCALINVERGLDPLRESLSELTPTVNNLIKERNALLKDYNSFRRRLKSLQEKKIQLETAGKGNTTAAKENLAEITKFESKEASGKMAYEAKNKEVKEKIIASKQLHDQIMNKFIASTIVCQYELYSRAAKELENVIKTLPQEEVNKVKYQINDLINQGGVRIEKKEKTKFEKGLAILTGKALPSDFKKPENEVNTSESSHSPTPIPSNLKPNKTPSQNLTPISAPLKANSTNYPSSLTPPPPPTNSPPPPPSFVTPPPPSSATPPPPSSVTPPPPSTSSASPSSSATTKSSSIFGIFSSKPSNTETNIKPSETKINTYSSSNTSTTTTSSTTTPKNSVLNRYTPNASVISKSSTSTPTSSSNSPNPFGVTLKKTSSSSTPPSPSVASTASKFTTNTTSSSAQKFATNTTPSSAPKFTTNTTASSSASWQQKKVEVKSSPPPVPPVPPVTNLPMVRVIYDLKATNSDELDIKAGDLIEVLETGADGWWKGRLKNKVGFFPVNYVESI